MRTKRIVACILVAVLLNGIFPGWLPQSEAAGLQPAPTAQIEKNTLLIGGRRVEVTDALMNYQFLLVRGAEGNRYQPKDFNDAFIASHEIFVDPDRMKEGCLRWTASKTENITLEIGDLFYVRKATKSVVYTQWQTLLLVPQMFALSSATSQSQLPGLVMKEDSAVISPKDTYTEYEYAVVDLTNSSAALTWQSVGSLYGRTERSITVNFLPRSTDFAIRVRVAGDDRPGYLYVQAKGIAATSPRVYLSSEVLGPFGGGASGRSWFVSTNGGSKWQLVNVGPGAERFIDLSKVFGKKEVEIIVREAKTGQENPNELTVNVLRQTYNPRPVFPKDISVTPMASASNPQNFSFSGYGPGQAYEYRMDGQSQIYAPVSFAVGLPLLMATEQMSGKKAAKIYMRLPANTASYTPASLPKKFNQVKQVKAPGVKVDYKKETMKTKVGQFYAAATSAANPENLSYTAANGDVIDVSKFITDGATLYIYQGETDKKPRSAIQAVQLGQRFARPDDMEGLQFSAGKLKLLKGYEILGSAEKWGNLKKGDTEVLIRKKTNAKFNSKSGTTSGNAASAGTVMKINYDSDGKTILGVTMEGKLDLPLKSLGLEVPNGGNGVTAYAPKIGNTDNRLIPGVKDYYVAQSQMMNSSNQPLSTRFQLYFEGLVEDVNLPPIASAALLRPNGQEVAALTGGLYEVSNAKLGERYTLVLEPADPNAYRTTYYTVSIIEPLVTAPYSVEFGYGLNPWGRVAVTMRYNLTRNDELKLSVRLVKVEAAGEREIAVKKETFQYDMENASNNNSFAFYFHEEMATAGRGLYRCYAYVDGEKGRSSNSESVRTGNLQVDLSDLRLCRLSTATSGDFAQGGTVSVTQGLDNVGNDLTAHMSLQWRYSTTGPITESNPGIVMTGVSSMMYPLKEADEGRYIGVRASALGAYVFHSFGQVKRQVKLETVEPSSPIIHESDLDEESGLYPIVFTYSGLDPAHTLLVPPLATNPAPAPNSSIILSAKTEAVLGDETNPPVILSIDHYEHDTTTKTVTLWLKPELDGQTLLTVSIAVGSGLTGYLSNPSLLTQEVMLVNNATPVP